MTTIKELTAVVTHIGISLKVSNEIAYDRMF